ncbi:MAG: AraC family transcriptional regulator [Lachnospiraceae bacterium]|nr:AraC family transcriptional regulator [Lachnospiraceae bacterium]
MKNDGSERLREITDDKVLEYELQKSEESIIHMPRSMVLSFFQCISEGDVEGTKAILQSVGNPSTFANATFATSPLKQLEYTAILSISMTARAAMDGGLDPYKAYELNDLYLCQISSTTKPEDYLSILQTALLRFATEVRRVQKEAPDSYHVRRCKNYVAQHINQHITVETLAQELKLTPNYLSHLFVNQTGVRLKTYILQARIQAAESMLRFSAYPIDYIASFLCFNSQSYFGKRFKEFTGLTPLEYRNKYQST